MAAVLTKPNDKPRPFSVTVNCDCGHQHNLPWSAITIKSFPVGKEGISTYTSWPCPESKAIVVVHKDE